MADDDWRFAVEDVGDAEDAEEATAEDNDNDNEPAIDERPPLEPGSPSIENALFVVLGVLVTLFAIVRAVGL